MRADPVILAGRRQPRHHGHLRTGVLVVDEVRPDAGAAEISEPVWQLTAVGKCLGRAVTALFTRQYAKQFNVDQTVLLLGVTPAFHVGLGHSRQQPQVQCMRQFAGQKLCTLAGFAARQNKIRTSMASAGA
ncbi:hypothetical protein [Massilia sp. PAMC28688]|uniref:hypothetical protein n=1 Tax=Massilia sp. PAMC28688 TaxID=2861283 RepID=UPI001E3A832C|nr:hypothetical protein [Massilia sp. PAMC28688]